MIFISLFIYNLIIYFLLILIILFFPLALIYILKTKKYQKSFLKRLCIVLDKPKNITKNDQIIWLHAVSVGETLATIEFQKQLKKSFPNYKLLFTVSTETGYEIAYNRCKNADFIAYFPLDYHFSILRFINQFNIKALILTETEIWPNLIFILKQKNIPIFIINGRISKRSFRNYFKYKFIFKPIFSLIDKCMMQTISDAKKIKKLGAKDENIVVTGNIKYDEVKNLIKLQNDKIYDEFGFKKEDLVFILGSIHPGEYEIIVNACYKIKQQFNNIKIIIAPRKLDKVEELYLKLNNLKLNFEKRSELIKNNLKFSSEILILDTIGELAKLYQIAKVVFIGGSLIDIGGHNILEPAAFGKPILFGPYIHNFKDIATSFLNNHAGIMIKNEEELISQVIKIIQLPDKDYQNLSLKVLNEANKNFGSIDKIILYLKKHINFVIMIGIFTYII